MADFTLYWPGDSFWHLLDPRSKMLAGFIMCLLIFQTQKPAGLIILLLLLCIGIKVSQVPLGIYYRSLRAFLLLITISMGMQCYAAWQSAWAVEVAGILWVDYNALIQACILGAKIICMVLVTALFSLTTSPVAIIDASAKMLNPFSKIGLPVGELQMIMYIAYRFLPLLIQESQNIREAQLCRGIDMNHGHPGQRMIKRLAVVVPLLQRALLGAEQLAESMEARAYDPGQARSAWRGTGLGARDYIVITFSGLFLAGLVFR